MKQKFNGFIKKKFSRGFSFLLCATMVLNMIPLFEMPTSAQALLYDSNYFTVTDLVNIADTGSEYKANGNGSNIVEMIYRPTDHPNYTEQERAMIQAGAAKLRYVADIWTGTVAWNWAKYTISWNMPNDNCGNNFRTYQFNTGSDTTVINQGTVTNNYGDVYNIYESKGTKRFVGTANIPIDAYHTSIQVRILQPANGDTNWGPDSWGNHDALAILNGSASIQFSGNIPTVFRHAPTASIIISGQTLSNSTITNGFVCSQTALNNLGEGDGKINGDEVAKIKGDFSWSNPNTVITSSTNAQVNFTPLLANFNKPADISINIPVRAAVITLDANGGTVGSSSAEGWFGSKPATITIPTRTGYAFKGYYSTATGGTQYFYASGTAVKDWDIAADTTLYAQWEEKCTVSNISAPAAVVTGSKLSLVNPTITGASTSQSWQYSANGSTGWTNFDPSTKSFTASENGYYVRYYATNAAGTTTSNTVKITVNKYTPALSISASPASTTYPTNVVLTATLTGADSISSKAVKLYDGTNYLITLSTDVNGEASYTVTSPTAVTHSYKAVFEGDSNNVAVSSSSLSYNVGKGTQSAVSFASTNDIVKTYGDTTFTLPTVSGGTGTGSYSYRSGNTAVATVSGNSVTIKGAGEATIYVKKLGDTNYNDSSEASIKIKVAPKSVIISGVSANSKTYDGSPTASINIANAVINGVINSDAVSIDTTYASASFYDANAAIDSGVSFSGFALTGSKAGNYTLAAQPENTIADIRLKPIIISGITANDKVYDGNNFATLVMPTITTEMGVVSGDTITVNISGLFEDKDAGTNKTVNISYITLGGTDANNYMLTATGNQSTATASINRKEIVVTPNALFKNYGQNDPTFSYTYSEPVTSETAKIFGSLSRSIGETVGSYQLGLGTLALMDNNTFLQDNYYLSLSDTTVNFTINNVVATTSDYEVTGNKDAWNRTDLILTPKGDYVKVSTDGTNWSNSLTLNTEGAASSANFYLIKSDGTITDQTTYTYKLDKTAPTGTLTIQTNSWTYFLNKMTFGLFFKENVKVSFAADTDESGIAKTEFIKTETVYNEVEIKTATGWADFSDTTITAADKVKFIYYIRLTDNAGNVSYISSEGITFDNTKPSITADYQKGDSDVTFTVADETAGIVSVTYTIGDDLEQSATLDANGQFTISDLADGKYNIEVKATDKADNIYSFTQTITSRHTVKYMDGSSQLGETLTADYGEALTKPEDPEKAGNIFSGWYKDNGFNTLWSFTSDNVTSDTILYAKYIPKQSVPAGITQADVVYGTAVNPTVSCISTGEQTIEYKVKGTDDTTYTTSKPINVGEYIARVRVAESGIHLAATATGDFKITPKELTVTGLAINNKIYDGTRTASFSNTPILNGITYSDDITLINGTPSFADENVGTAKAVSFTNFAISGSAASNYTLTQPASTMANVTAKTITVTPAALSKNFGQTDPTLTYTCTNAISGETGNFVGMLARATGETAGSYPINLGTLALEDNGAFKKANYKLELSASTVNFTINAVQATTSDYEVTGNEGAWNNADLTIAPSGDYVQISTDKINWRNSITLSTEGSESIVDFYLKKTDGTTTDKVNYTYNLDKTAPTGTISQGDNNWAKFLNTITFGLFFKENQNVSISSADTNGSGVASTGYYVLEVDNNKVDFEATLEQAKDYTYKTGTLFNIQPEKNVIVFAKIVDNAGNITYINSKGMVFEETAPVISGITDGETYYTTREVTVKDENLDKVTVNKEAFSVNTIAGDVDKTYTVVATDKAGNSTTYTVTMKTIASLSTAIDSLTTSNVKSSDKSAIEAVKSSVSSVELTNATQAEKDKLKVISDKCDVLLSRISAVANEIQVITTKLGDTTNVNAKSSDSARLTEVKTELERLLATENITDAEKASLEAKLGVTNQAIAEISKVADEISAVTTKLNDTTKDNAKSSDSTRLSEVKTELERLLGTQNLTDAEKASLEAQLSVTNQAIAEIAKVADEISAVTTKLNDTTKDNVKSSDNARLTEVKTELERLLGTQNLTDAEKASLEAQLTITDELIAEIAKVADEISAVTTKLGDTTKDNAKSSDNARLTEVKTELERLLGTQNLTDAEKASLEAKLGVTNQAIAEIAKVTDEISAITTKLGDTTKDNAKSSDSARLAEVKAELERLLGTENLAASEKAILQQKKTDVENALVIIAEIAGKIADASTKTDGITTNNVKSSDRLNLDDALTTITDLLATDNLTDSERAALEQKKTDVENILAKIDEVENAVINAKDSVKDITKDNVTKEDRTKLKETEEDLQNILEDFASNLTDTEKVTIEDQIKSIQVIIKILDDVTAVEDLIKSLPNQSDVTKDDANNVKKAEDDFNKLADHQKDLTDPVMVTKLIDVSNALKKLLLFDAPTGTKIEGIDGTEFDVRTELVVKPIKDTLDKTTMSKFAICVTNAAKNQEIAQLYDVKLLLNGQPIQPDGKVKIILKLTEEQQNYKDLQVVYIADDGTVTIIPCEINGNEVSFITDHFSYYGIIGTPVKSSLGNKTNPGTGDNMPVIPYIIFAFLSAVALAITTRKRKFRVIKK